MGEAGASTAPFALPLLRLCRVLPCEHPARRIINMLCVRFAARCGAGTTPPGC